MQNISVRSLFRETPEDGAKVRVSGWVRTVRSSNAFAFIEVNDGTFFKNLQVVCEGSMPDYAAITAAMEASDFAKAAVYWAVHEGIIQGNAAGQLRLHDAITKEQAVVMLYRMEV